MNRTAVALQGVRFGRSMLALQGFSFSFTPPAEVLGGLVYSPWRSPLRFPWRISVRW